MDNEMMRGMSPYEHFIMTDKTTRRPNGASVAALVLGSVGTVAVAVSFLCSYAAMWLTLALDAAAVKYNYIYGKITENTGAEKGTEAPDASSGEDGPEAGAPDEVPQMQLKDDTLRDD